MKKISKNSCKSASHKLFKDKAKNRVDDLQLVFLDLQFARKESRTVDAAVLEEQVHQMLREWKAELNEPSPASSLQQVRSYSCMQLVDIFQDIYHGCLFLTCIFLIVLDTHEIEWQ